MSIILQGIDNKINNLKNEFQLHKGLNHQGVKGNCNEELLKDIIKDVIPKKYIISSGIIENHNGVQSNETDLIVIDDEIIPPYMKSSELSIVPIEAVKYNFEVKSTLTKKEIITTIKKFNHFLDMGGNRSTRVLFAFSSDQKSDELNRLKDNDENFFHSPAINVLCVSDKSYYFTVIKKKKFINSPFAMPNGNLTKEITVNDVNLHDLSYWEITWVGFEGKENAPELSFLSGISNTLSKGKLGYYLLSHLKRKLKVYSICFKDPWGNISGAKYFEKGIDHTKLSIEYTLNVGSSEAIFNTLVEE